MDTRGARTLRNRRKAIATAGCIVAAAAVPAAAFAQVPIPSVPSPPKDPVKTVTDPVKQVTDPVTNPVTKPTTSPTTPTSPATQPTGGSNTTTSPASGVSATTPVTNVGVGQNGVKIGGTNTTPSTGGGSSGVSIGGVSVTAGGNSSSPSGAISVGAGGSSVATGNGTANNPSGTIHVGDVVTAAGDTAHGTIAGHNVAIGQGGVTVDRTGVHIGGQGSGAGGLLGGGGIGVGPGGVTFTNTGGLGQPGGGVTITPGGGVKVSPGSGGSPGIGGLLPGAGTVRAGGFPIAGGSLGALPGLGLFGNNPAFAVGGSAGMIAPDSPNALRGGAVGAFQPGPDVLGRGLAGDGSLAIEGMNALPGRDFPAGVLGIDPARAAAMYANEASGGRLTPAALVAQQLPASGGTGLVNDIGNAIDSVIAGLPDWSRPIIIVLLLLAFAMWLRAFINGRRARRLNAHLASEREKNEILAAENLVYQRALVPALPGQLNGIAVSAHYRPADMSGAGGDFYDVFALDKNRVAIILGDVSGHDRSAVDRANTIRHSLRTHLWDDHEPRTVLKKAGAALARDETLDGDFATAIVAIHDTAAGTLTYACAGHPAPVLVGAAAHEPVSVCSSPALGWGIPTGRRQTRIVLGDGDTVCFYTDGLIEARFDGGFLGPEGLEKLVEDLGAHGTAEQLLGEIIDRAHEADDDLAALILRAGTPTTPRGLRIEELEISDLDVRRRSPVRFLTACGLSEDAIEQLEHTMDVAVAATGRALLKVTYDPEMGAEPHVTVDPLGTPRMLAPDDPRVLVGD